MHVLILGGTRFVGRHITEAALARGHRVTLFNRGQSADGAALFPSATHLVGDRAAGDYAALEGLAFDAVVDTCAYYPRAIRQALDALAPGLSGPYAFISSVSAFASLEAPDQD